MIDKRLSVYICYLLRHKPEDLNLEMDIHGWVKTKELISKINGTGKYKLSIKSLEEIVYNDEKGRFAFDKRHTKIKACQGHSIPWIILELTNATPPDVLYHGTTTEALKLIYDSGNISKMKRHAVHMQADYDKAMKSAVRWKGKTPVVLSIDAKQMVADGYQFAVSDNNVWCIESVPIKYVNPIYGGSQYENET